MKKTKINDMFAKGGYIRDDGRMVHDMYLMQVKTPDKSTEPWDYYNVVETFKGEAAWHDQGRHASARSGSDVAGAEATTTMEIFGIPLQAFLGQLLLGLVNGSFYAMLSLGLAVIFGLLGIVNFAHGALYMIGAYVAWLGLEQFGHQLLGGAAARAAGRRRARRRRSSARCCSTLYKLDPIYGLLLTFGLALIAEGVFRDQFGVSGQQYPVPELLQGATNLGFMVLPNYRAWVVFASLVVCLGTWFVIETTRLGANLRAGTENPALVQAFGINVPLMVTLTYGGGAGAGRVRRRARRAGDPGHAADGQQPDHRGLRGGRDRRHGLDPRLDPDRPGARPDRGPDQGVLPRGLEHRRLRHHGHRADGPAGRPVRQGEVMSDAAIDAPLAAIPPQSRLAIGLVRRPRVLVAAPFIGLYPVFVMKALCFAIFACAFNLLLGYTGLLSFGHAAFLGSAAYATGWLVRSAGWSPELGVLAGIADRRRCSGLVVGLIAIRRQGIYFAMITLAMAQMIYFVCLQAPFTGGEDGLQGVPRGKLFGLLPLANDLTLYYVVLAVFVAVFLFIIRIVHSPFGQVLKAIRENEPRADLARLRRRPLQAAGLRAVDRRSPGWPAR